ncbi:gene transfer agent family protein [Jannaschia sp. M317]|uniref:gene transfer agent family protein n=1 Tax=Jannaschia sp. M317 TaxID=2867011 RepID=UPI0021A4835D|nr:gene transfer agent family protein [Jannaschia sp. M317]UWQ16156.1 gene transfer agent family protein [Jannaschia sp. M317]
MRGAVEFEAGGQTYEFRLTISRLAAFQKRLDESFIDALRAFEDSGGTDFSRLFEMLACGLGCDPDAAVAIVDEMDVAEAGRVLGAAVKAFFPQAENDQEAGEVQGDAAPEVPSKTASGKAKAAPKAA